MIKYVKITGANMFVVLADVQQWYAGARRQVSVPNTFFIAAEPFGIKRISLAQE
jgi:hypothetical protein